MGMGMGMGTGIGYGYRGGLTWLIGEFGEYG